MPARKDRLKKQKESREAPRFTVDDIVRAIEAVQKAGLKVYGVEISLNAHFKRAAASKPETGADALNEVQPNKWRA